jgi:pSer/pThr/pTyr-binding forkhead associated (FHA) protein
LKTPVFLRIYENGKLINVKQFTDEQIVIGSNDGIQLSLKGEGVYPLHACIDERDKGHYVLDLGSQMGTFKNGHKIFDEAIESGDELQIGPYKIEFFVGVPKPTAAPRDTSTAAVTPPSTPVAAPPTQTVAPTPTPPTAQTTTPVAPSKSKMVDAPPPVQIVKKKESPGYAAAATSPVAVTPAAAVTPPPAAKEKKPVEEKNVKPSASTLELANRYRSSKGTIVEVVVAWRERVIGTYHFKDVGNVTMGSDETSTIAIPLIGTSKTQHILLKIEGAVRVCFTQEMSGDYYKNDEELTLADLKRKNRVTQVDQGFELPLAQGEMVRLGLFGDVVSIYVRYTQETAAPIIGSLFDLTTSEATAVLMSIVIAAIFGLYMAIYSPKALEDETKLEEPVRKAIVTFNPPVKKIVQVAEAEHVEQKKVVKVADKTEQTTTKADPGAASKLRPSLENKKTNKISSTVNQGAAVKTGKSGAAQQSEKKDVTQMGMLSSFGGKGMQNDIAKAYQGTEGLIGDANQKTGFSGSTDERAGENLGGRIKNVGAGGKGASTYGINNVGTEGKGTASAGAGTGGIGKKGRVDLNVGESEAEFTGTIDREAIRRVIRENIKQFQFCYDQALRKHSDAYGKVEVKWFIREHGKATDTVVKSNTVGDTEMGNCIARVIRGLTFPEPPQDQIAEVTYPFVFASQ